MKEADRNFIKSIARDLMVNQGLSCYEAVKQTLRFMSHYNETMARLSENMQPPWR